MAILNDSIIRGNATIIGNTKVIGDAKIASAGNVTLSASNKTTTVNGALIVDNTLNANNDIIINNANKLFVRDQNNETIVEAGEDVGRGGYVLSTVGNVKIFGDLSFAGSGEHYARLTLDDDGNVVFDKINTGLYVKNKAGKPGIIFGDLNGNASTTTKFNNDRTIKLSGDVSGSASSNGNDGWSITNTAIGAGKVTNAMLAGSISNEKLSNNSIKIGTTSISLGKSASSISGLTSLTASADTSYISLTGSNSYISLTGSNSYIKTKKIKKDSYIYDLPDKSGALGLKTFNTINGYDGGWLYSGNRLIFGLNKSTNNPEDTSDNIGRYKYEGLEYNTDQQMFINYNNFSGHPEKSFSRKPCQFAWSFWGEDSAGSVMQLTHNVDYNPSVVLNVNGKVTADEISGKGAIFTLLSLDSSSQIATSTYTLKDNYKAFSAIFIICSESDRVPSGRYGNMCAYFPAVITQNAEYSVYSQSQDGVTSAYFKFKFISDTTFEVTYNNRITKILMLGIK